MVILPGSTSRTTYVRPCLVPPASVLPRLPGIVLVDTRVALSLKKTAPTHSSFRTLISSNYPKCLINLNKFTSLPRPPFRLACPYAAGGSPESVWLSQKGDKTCFPSWFPVPESETRKRPRDRAVNLPKQPSNPAVKPHQPTRSPFLS
jgi:hypothetical protein